MSPNFNQLQNHARVPNIAPAYVVAGILALGAVGFEAVHTIINDANSDVKGVAHAITNGIAALKPGQTTLFEAQEAIDSVSLPDATQLIAAPVSGSTKVETFKTFPVFGGKVPFSSVDASVFENGTVAITAPPNAVTGRTVYELPGSTTANPKLAATVTVNADSLYAEMVGPSPQKDKKHHLKNQNHDDFIPRGVQFLFGGSPDGKYTGVLTDVENNRLQVECGQALGSLAAAGFQRNFYDQARQTSLTKVQSAKPDAPAIKQAIQELGNGSIPVTVKFVNAEGQTLNPQAYTLKGAGTLMSKQEIASELGVGSDNLTLTYSSPCQSKPQAVAQQVALQENYVTHTAGATAAAFRYNGQLKG
jgi:hypothetical protein